MSPSTTAPAREGLAALVAFLPRAWRAKWVGLVVMLLGLGGTAAWALSTHRLYRSEAVIAYERGITNPLTQAQSDSPRSVGARLQDMFASRQRMETIIKDMKLYPKLVDRLGMVDAVDEMRAHFKIALRESFTYRVSFDGDDRDRTQKVLAALVKSVVDEDMEHRKKDAEDAKHFLDTERQHADEDLRAKESVLAEFLTKHPQLAGEAAATPGGTIRAADRERDAPVGADVAALEVQSAHIEEQLANGDHPREAAPGKPGSIVDPVLASAQERALSDLHAARRDLTDKQSRFTDDHPDVKAAWARLKEAEAAARQATAAVTAAAAATPPAAVAAAEDAGQARNAALRRALAAVRSQIGAVRPKRPTHEVTSGNAQSMVAVDTEWTRTSRAVEEARERQQQLEAKQFQAQLTATMVAAGQAGGLVVTDPPFRPTRPVTGGRFKITMVGFGGSLALALAAIFVAGTLDRRLYDSRDVSRVVDVEILVVPRLTGKVG